MENDRRTRLTPDERRAQLVALGVAFLADNPLDQLTIEDLSARAGVSRGLLFHYFGSKQGLHREVVRTARDAMLHATEPVAGLAPLDRLHDTLERIVAFVVPAAGTELDKAALDQRCLDAIARHKRPKEYRPIDALPRNAAGKVLKKELRVLAEAGDDAG